MKRIAAFLSALLFPALASATPVIQFAQTASTNTITGTANAGDTATTISGGGVAVNVTQDLGGFLGLASFAISATSTDAAVPVGTGAIQHYSGSFSIMNGLVDVLSGTFTDAALGVGSALTLAIGAPPDSLHLTSDLIPAFELQLPEAVSFSLTNVIPPVAIVGSTIESFTATLSGNASATEVVGEPETLAMFGIGLAFLGIMAKRKPPQRPFHFDCI